MDIIGSIKKGKNLFKKIKNAKRKIKIVLIIIILLLILLLLYIIYSFIFGWLTGEKHEQQEEQNDQTITLTIGDGGLFKTSVQKNTSNKKYELYAVLDEMVFREYINTNNYKDLFRKDTVISEMLENDNNSNVSNSDQENSEDEQEYRFLKELIIRLTASSYPEDVKFVTNKTLKFSENEDSSNQDIVDKKIKEIKNESGTKTISGGISLYRNDKGSKIKFVPARQYLDDAYYTIENGKIVVSYSEKIMKSEDGSISKQTNEVKYKEFDYQEIISPYIMPMSFVEQLYIVLQSEQFLYYVSQIVSSSHIDLIIFENKTESTLDMIENYRITGYYRNNPEPNNSNNLDADGNPIPDYIDTEEKVTHEEFEAKSLKMYVLNVDNWVAKIQNKYGLGEDDQVIYDNEFTKQNYEELLEMMEKSGAPSLKNAIINRINEFGTKDGEKKVPWTSPATGEEIELTLDTTIELKKETVKLRTKSKTYTMLKDKSVAEDNTDYFCGLIKNSQNKEKFGKEYNATQLTDPKSAYKYSLKDIKKVEEAKGLLGSIKDFGGDIVEKIKSAISSSEDLEEFSVLQKMFPEYDKKGNAICYIETGTNMLVCPYTALEDQKDIFLSRSEGRFDETIYLIWDKLYGEKSNKNTTIKDMNLKELENEDINDTSTNLKNFIKSHEGTTITVRNGISYHVSYLDSKGIPTTAWGINLFQQFPRFERYLGDIVYTPAFYMAVEEGKHNETNSFIIPDNIIEIIFNEMVDQKVMWARGALSGGVSRGYYPTEYEVDAITMVIWGYGNFGDDYIKTVLDALKQSKRSNSLDKTDRKKLFNYYDYLRNNLKTRDGTKYFDEKGIPKIEYLIYTDGIYYRRYGELIGAETQPIKHALEKYEKLVDYGYKYDEKSVFFNSVAYADDPGYYASSKNNPDNVPLTINDYEYVTWVLKDLGYLESVYTNYESLMKGLVLDKTSNDYQKLQIVDNRGQNGIEKTIKEYDDLLPGDIIIIQEGSKKSIKIYAGRKNWIEMDSETLEDLKDDGKRENDRYNWCISAPIANYKGEGKELDMLYGKNIDLNDILWLFRNEEIANQYIYNNSYQYTNWEIKDFKLTRKSSFNLIDVN